MMNTIENDVITKIRRCKYLNQINCCIESLNHCLVWFLGKACHNLEELINTSRNNWILSLIISMFKNTDRDHILYH